MRKITFLIAFLLFVGMQVVDAQRKISGTVFDEKNETLPGVSVMVKGTTLGMITDIDGKYSLEVPNEATHLVFSFVGMQKMEVEIGSQTSINPVMKQEELTTGEVVVTALGIAREKKALGYAAQDVGSEELSKGNNANVVNSIAGKVSGVRINSSSGAAGSSTFIEVRGASSLTGNNRPLFVVDGVPIESGGGETSVDGVATSDRAVDINPDDIESMSVLKGGAATALYGLRASNGAIIITTKKGKGGKTNTVNANFSSSVTIEQISQVPELQNKFAQGSVKWNRNPKALQYSSPDGPSHRTFSWGPNVDKLSYTTKSDYYPSDTSYWKGYVDMATYMKKWNPNGRIVFKDDPAANGKSVQVHDPYDFFQTGYTFNNALNFSGGTEDATYYFSASNMYTEGVIPNNTFSKTTLKLSGQAKFSEKWRSEANVSYMKSGGDRIQQGSNTSGIMLGLLRTPPTFDNSYGYEFADGTQRCYRGSRGYDNPYWVANKIKYSDETNRMLGNVNMTFTAMKGLSFTYRLGTDWYSQRYRNYFAIGSSASATGGAETYQEFAQDFNSDLFMNWNKNFTADLNMNLTIGANLYSSYSTYTKGSTSGLVIPNWDHLSNTQTQNAAEVTTRKRTAAYFADLGLSYKSMVFLNLTGRHEWSTTMPEDDDNFLYPSVSLGFVFTELPSLQNNAIISFGKLRASWAKTANDASPYNIYTTYGMAIGSDGWTQPFGFIYPLMGYPGFTYNDAMGNASMKPESMTSVEFGADIRFLSNRIRLDITYFNNNNSDLLLNVPISPSSGHRFMYINAATMETKGIEILAGVTPVKTKDFTWDIIMNFSNSKSTVTELYGDDIKNVSLNVGFEDPQFHAIKGEPYRTIWGTRMLRHDGKYVINDAYELVDEDGDGKFEKAVPTLDYGAPQGDPETGIIGQVQPNWTMGITNSFSWKGISFSFLIDIKSGGQMWNGTKGALSYFGTAKQTENRETATKVFDGKMGHLNVDGKLVHNEIVDDPDKPGSKKIIEVDGPGSANSTSYKLDVYWYTQGPGSTFTGPCEPYIESSEYVRLREVSISYVIPKSFLMNKTFFKGAEVYFTGRNLWLSTPYTGVDPETSLFGAGNAQGCDYFNMPGTKAYTFGLKLNF